MNVAEVERELGRLWKEAGPTVTRASLFNFIALARNETERIRAMHVITELTVRHPCRAVVVTAEASAPTTALSVEVTALCHLAGGGGKQVCCELLHVSAPGKANDRVSSAVIPLLESDLPTVLWHLGDPTGPSLGLESAADRVVFDGANCTTTAALAVMHNRLQSQRRLRYADLAWTRLSLWRKLLADCFDDPHAAGLLAVMEQLRVVHGCGPGAEWRARLFAGWVAARLGWSVKESQLRVIFECREGHDVTALGLLGVELLGPGAAVQLRKDFAEHSATAQVMMPAVCSLPRRQAFAPVDETQLLSRELDHAGRHAVYEAALALAAGQLDSPTVSG